MSSLRVTRINELLRKYLAEIMVREITLKNGVFMTIAKIDTSQDLRYTQIFISVFPEQETHYVSQTLKKELSQIQKSLYAKLSMKPLPKLSFVIDKTEQEADEIEKVLRELF